MSDVDPYTPKPRYRAYNRVVVVLGLVAVAILSGARFVALDADPPLTAKNRVGSFFGDEGCWYKANVWQETRGHWHVPKQYNPAVVTPTLPIVAAGVQATTGMDAWPASRWSTAGLTVLGLSALMWAVWRRGGVAPAVLTGLFVASSYLMWAYSRVSLLDAPASALAVGGLALLMGWPDKRPAWATVLAACLGFTAVLAKTTMLAVMPAYLVAAWMTASWPGTGHPDRGRPWRDALIVAGIGASLLVAFGIVLLSVFAEDWSLFRRSNLRVNPNSGGTLQHFTSFVRATSETWPGLFLLAWLALPVAWLSWRRTPASPWVLTLALWGVLMAGAVLYKGLAAPRYFVPLIWPAAVLSAFAVVGAWRSRHAAGRGAAVVLTLLGAITIGHDAVRSASSLSNLTYSFRDAGRDVRRVIGETADLDRAVIAGRWPTESLGLVANLPTLDISCESLDGRSIEELGVQYFACRPPLHDPRHADQTHIQHIKAHYDAELVAEYHVLPGYQTEPLPISLYRIRPRENP